MAGVTVPCSYNRNGFGVMFDVVVGIVVGGHCRRRSGGRMRVGGVGWKEKGWKGESG